MVGDIVTVQGRIVCYGYKIPFFLSDMSKNINGDFKSELELMLDICTTQVAKLTPRGWSLKMQFKMVKAVQERRSSSRKR